MYYIVKSDRIEVDLPSKLEDILENEGNSNFDYCPTGVITFDYSDEGFDVDDVKIYLKYATSKGTLKIHYEDHKGDGVITLKYGPGFCEEV